MKYSEFVRCWIAATIAAAVLSVSLPFGPAQAGLVATDQVLQQALAQQDRDRVLEFLLRGDVRQQMESLGVDPNEASERLESLTDLEIARIAGRIDQLPAGQDAASAIIGGAVAIFVILIITDILGFTDVFSFVSSIEQ